MTILILSAAFVALVMLGLPISFAMGISSLAALLYQSELPFNLIVHRTMMGVDSFVLLSIPLFIFAGTVMEQGGISEKLVRFAYTLLGRFRGGLPMVVVGSTMLQSGISGSTVADVSAMSAMTLRPLEDEGYPRPYSLSLIGASCAFAILIPPCILMVIVAAVANTSVVAVFAGGILPAVVLGVMMLSFVHIQARRADMPAGRSGGASVTFLLGSALFCSNTALFGIASHMVAYGEYVGMGPAAAGALMSALFGITLFSRLGVGLFLARGGVFRVMLAMSLLHMVGTWMVFASASPWTLVAGLMAMGLGFGGYLPAFGSLVRTMFPAREAGRRLSELYLLGFFGAGTGSWLVGALRDVRGGQWDARLPGDGFACHHRPGHPARAAPQARLTEFHLMSTSP